MALIAFATDRHGSVLRLHALLNDSGLGGSCTVRNIQPNYTVMAFPTAERHGSWYSVCGVRFYGRASLSFTVAELPVALAGLYPAAIIP